MGETQKTKNGKRKTIGTFDGSASGQDTGGRTTFTGLVNDSFSGVNAWTMVSHHNPQNALRAVHM